MKNRLLLLTALNFGLVCRADTTISWPADFQENLSAHILGSRPACVTGTGESEVVSFSCFSSVSPAYGTDALTFESIWRSTSVSGGFSGFSFGMPGFWIFMR